MKIFFLADDFYLGSSGGAGVVSFWLAKNMVKRGHSISVITTTRNLDEEDLEGSEWEGLRIFKIYADYHKRWRAYLSLYNPQTIKKVRKILKQHRPDIVNAHNVHFFLSYYSLKLAKQCGARVVLTAHDAMLFMHGKLDLNYSNSGSKDINYKTSILNEIKKHKRRYNPLRNTIIRHYLKNVDRIVTVSQALKNAINQNGIMNVEVIRNGISVAEWSAGVADIEEFKKKNDLLDKKIILFGGRLSAAKGGHEIIAALEKIVEQVPKALLLVIGYKNSYAESIDKFANRRGLGKNIYFTGYLSGDGLKSAYSVSDVVVVPSIGFDSFPTVVLEAMASRKPVVGTCYGGTPEMIIDGVTGYVVDPNDVAYMAEKIVRLLNDGHLATVMGQRGYERVSNNFDINIATDRYLDLFINLF